MQLQYYIMSLTTYYAVHLHSQYWEGHYPLSSTSIRQQALITRILGGARVSHQPHVPPEDPWGSSLASQRPLAPMERESRPLQAPLPPKLIGHHRAAGRWLQDGSYLYLFWKPRWRAGSAQVWPPRGAAGARNMGPRTPLTPLRKLWPSSLEYSCESTCE